MTSFTAPGPDNDASGNVVWTRRYENGRRVGGLDGSVTLDQSSDSRPLAGHRHEAASGPHDEVRREVADHFEDGFR